MNILAIETSCDETSVAIYNEQHGLIAQQTYSQISVHEKYGGVVPELAARDHIRKFLPLIKATLQDAHLNKQDINVIAYTKGPGLIGALLVGVSVAKTLGLAFNIPTIGVHHMEAHLLAPMLEDIKPTFPFLALLISGGHTMLIEARNFRDYKILGESIDDAVGEAFDKTAKLLNLPYPGGPELEKLAVNGNSKQFKFPRPMTDKPGLNFSFSGLKTFTRTTFNNNINLTNIKADIACAFQSAVAETLAIKCARAISETNLKQLVVAGGVSANKTIRKTLIQTCDKLKTKVFFPRHEFCTDNAAMVAYTGAQYLKHNIFDKNLQISALARWEL